MSCRAQSEADRHRDVVFVLLALSFLIAIVSVGCETPAANVAPGAYSQVDTNHGDAGRANEENSASLQIVWVSPYMDRHSTSEHFPTKWRIYVGILVTHSQEKLPGSISTTIGRQIAWFPRKSIELTGFGAPQMDNVTVAKDIWERLMIEDPPPSLAYVRTMSLADGRFASLGIAAFDAVEEPKAGVYRLQLKPSGFSNWDYELNVDTEPFVFYLRDIDDRPEQPLAKRLPWAKKDVSDNDK